MKLLCVSVWLILLVAFTPEGAGAAMRKSSYDFRVIQATSQRIIPGIPGAPIKTEFVFTVVWLTTRKPILFFWKDEIGWKNCTMSKSAEIVKKGDTLIIATIRGNVPQILPKSANNTICYKTVSSSGWKLVPVKNVIQKTDAVAP